MAENKQLIWQDFDQYVNHSLGDMTPEERQEIEKMIVRANNMRGKIFQGFNSEIEMYEAAKKLSARLGISLDQAKGIVHLWDNVIYRGAEPAGKDSGLLGPDDINPNDYATEEEYRAAILNAMQLQAEPGSEKEKAEVAQSAADMAAAEEAKKREDVTGRIQKFIDSMTGPARPDDPVRMALIQAGTDAAQMSAGSRGVRGGLANTAAASMTQANLAPYEAQRASLALQGINTLNAHDLGLAQLQQQDAQFAQQQADMMNAEKWKGQMGQRQAIGSTIGTALGALGFIGGPALGAMTMAAGGTLGGSIAGWTAPQQSPRYSSYTPQRRGITSGSSGKTGF